MQCESSQLVAFFFSFTDGTWLSVIEVNNKRVKKNKRIGLLNCRKANEKKNKDEEVRQFFPYLYFETLAFGHNATTTRKKLMRVFFCLQHDSTIYNEWLQDPQAVTSKWKSLLPLSSDATGFLLCAYMGALVCFFLSLCRYPCIIYADKDACWAFAFPLFFVFTVFVFGGHANFFCFTPKKNRL